MIDSGVIHYRTAFDILPLGGKLKGDLWRELVKSILTWAVKRNTKGWLGIGDSLPLNGRGSIQGGQWLGDKKQGIKIFIKSAAYDENLDLFQYWALRMEHNDSDFKGRRWYTDIGLEFLEDSNCVRMRVKLYHSMMPGFLGNPQEPHSSIPSIVKSVLAQSNKWNVTCGSISINPGYRQIKVGYGKEFVTNIIKDKNRKIPVVLISKNYQTNEPLVDPMMLANSLSGTARVFVTDGKDTDEEIRIYIGDNYRCMNGTIRLYIPMEDGELGDYRYHRFYLPFDIRKLGINEIAHELVNGLTRYNRSWLDRTIEDIDDVGSKIFRYKFDKLKSEANSSIIVQSEYDAFLDEWEKQETRYINTIAALEQQLDSIRKQYEAEKYKGEQLEHSLSVRTSGAEVTGINDVLDSLVKLPTTVADCFKLIMKLFPDRIVQDDEDMAYKSACATTFNDSHSCWDALFSIATILHDTKYGEVQEPRDFVKIYNDNKPYELSLTEGKATKRDARIMKQRQRLFKGISCDVTPHIKVRSGKAALRIHIAFLDDEQLILIGHCGDHLDTAGTRRRKQG